jgi:hypothetical protein
MLGVNEAMTRKSIIVAAAALATAFTAVPVLAQNVCLQNNRLQSTKVIDSQTILATDMDKKQYTIHLTAKCVGLDQFAQLLTFRPTTELGCLKHGDSIRYSLPGDPSQGAGSITVHGTQTQPDCTVDSVTAGAPVNKGK